MTLRQRFSLTATGPKIAAWVSLTFLAKMQIRIYFVPGEVPCLLCKGWLKEKGAVLSTSSEERVLTKTQITARGFWRGSDRNLRPSPTTVPEPELVGFAQHTFESTGDVLEDHDPEVLPQSNIL